jgi:dienelactone hydrolase
MVRTLGTLAALILIGGCASGPDTLPSPPAATQAGVLEFETAGGLQRSGRRGEYSTSAPARISGDLRFPEGHGPFPAIVLAHGCAGNRGVEPAWGALLRSWGYATFVLDSFRPRGITEVCTNAVTLVPLQRVPDAYGALRLLAAHPRIDARRIALMGFSHGGALTMLAATAWAKDTYAGGGLPAFRAFFPFYPNCNASFPERNRVSAPVRIHTGAADDWTPARPCAELAAALKAAGQDVAIEVYPGAHHAFDQARGFNYLPKVGNGSACFPVMASILGPVLSGGGPGCVKRGATVAPSPEAVAQARRNLQAQLSEFMRP